MAHRFEILREICRDYRLFGATGIQFTVRLNPPTDLDLNTVDHFLPTVNNYFEHVLEGVQDLDMVVVTIRNEVYQSDKPIGIGFRFSET
jgi:hypothetical protein